MKKYGVSILVAVFAVLVAGCDSEQKGPSINNYHVIGTDGKSTSSGQAVDISPSENLGRFSFSYQIPRDHNIKVQVAVVNDGDSVMLHQCCDNGCSNVQQNCQITNANTITCGTANADMTGHFSDHGGLPLDSKLELVACENSCSDDGFDFNFVDGQDCSRAAAKVVFR